MIRYSLEPHIHSAISLNIKCQFNESMIQFLYPSNNTYRLLVYCYIACGVQDVSRHIFFFGAFLDLLFRIIIIEM